MSRARYDVNNKPSLIAVSTGDGSTPVELWADPTTHALVVNASVSLSKDPIPASGLTQAVAVQIVDGSGNQIASFGGGTQYAELSTTSPGTGTLSLGRYKSSAPTLTDGQVYGLQLDNAGNLKVTGSLSVGGTTDNSAYTAGSSTGTPSYGFYHSAIDTVTDGRTAAIGMTSKRGMFVNLQNASGTEVGTSGAPLQVTLANTGANTNKILVTPDSVALPANQSVNESQINGVTPLMGNGVTGTGSQRVTIASDNTAFTVNAAQSGTWTNTVTQATAANLNATIVGTGTLAVQAAQSGTWNITNISGTISLPTGAATETTLAKLPLAQGSTTSGQSGPLVQGAVTTGAPTYTTAQTSPLSLDTAGNLRTTTTLGAGSAVIGHVITDTGSTTAVTGTVTVSGTVTANAGTNLNTSALALESGGNLTTLAGGVTASVYQSNVKQINGVTPLMGNGVTGTGSQRVTIASDNTAFSVNATLSAETTKVIGTVNQGTSPWVTSNVTTSVVGNGAAATAQRVTLANDSTGIIATVGAVTAITNALPAGTNVIGHVIADTGSTTAVTGNVTVVQGTGTNLHTVVDSGTLTAVTAITNALPTGANVIGKVSIDQTTPGTTNRVDIADSLNNPVSAFPGTFLRVTDEPTQLFYDPFDSAIDTTNRWTVTSGNSAVAASNATGVMTMGTGTTANGWSKLNSQPTFAPSIPAWLGVSDAIALPDGASPISNSYLYWGTGTTPGTPSVATPVTDGYGFERNTDGKLRAVVYAGGTRTVVQDLSTSGNSTQPTDAAYHRYIIYIRTDKAYWYIDGITSAQLVATSNFQSSQVQTLPRLFLTIGNATPPVSNITLTCTGATAWDTGKNNLQLSDGTFPWRKGNVDKYGALLTAQVVRANKVQQQTTITASTAETTVLTAVAATFLDVYGVIVVNTSATAADITFKDATAGTARFDIYVPAGETRGFMLASGDAHTQATSNNNWTAQSSASVTSIKITMFAVKNT